MNSRNQNIVHTVVALGIVFPLIYFGLVFWAEQVGALPDRDSMGQLYHPALAALQMLQQELRMQGIYELIPMGSYPYGPQILASMGHWLGLNEIIQNQFFAITLLAVVPCVILLSLETKGFYHKVLFLLCFWFFPITQICIKGCSLHSFNILYALCALLLLRRFQINPSYLLAALSIGCLALSISLKHLGFVQFFSLFLALFICSKDALLKSNLFILFLAFLFGSLSYPAQSYSTYLFDTLTHNDSITPWFYTLAVPLGLVCIFAPFFLRKFCQANRIEKSLNLPSHLLFFGVLLVSLANYPLDFFGYGLPPLFMKVLLPFLLLFAGFIGSTLLTRKMVLKGDSFIKVFCLYQTTVALFLFHSNLGYTHSTFQLSILILLARSLLKQSIKSLLALLIVFFMFSNFNPLVMRDLDSESMLRVSLESLYNQSTHEPLSWKKSHFIDHKREIEEQLFDVDFQGQDTIQGLARNLRLFEAFAMDSIQWHHYGFQEVHFNALNYHSAWMSVLKDYKREELYPRIVDLLKSAAFPVIYVPSQKISAWGGPEYWIGRAEELHSKAFSREEALHEVLQNWEVHGEMSARVILNYVSIEHAIQSGLLEEYFTPLNTEEGRPGTVWLHRKFKKTSRTQVALRQFLTGHPILTDDSAKRLNMIKLGDSEIPDEMLCQLVIKAFELQRDRASETLQVLRFVNLIRPREEFNAVIDLLEKDEVLVSAELKNEVILNQLLEKLRSFEAEDFSGMAVLLLDEIRQLWKSSFQRHVQSGPLDLNQIQRAYERSLLPLTFGIEESIDLTHKVINETANVEESLRILGQILSHQTDCIQKLSHSYQQGLPLHPDCINDTSLEGPLEVIASSLKPLEQALFHCRLKPEQSQCINAREKSWIAVKQNLEQLKSPDLRQLQILFPLAAKESLRNYWLNPSEKLYSKVKSIENWHSQSSDILYQQTQQYFETEPLKYLTLLLNSNALNPENHNILEDLGIFHVLLCETGIPEMEGFLKQLRSKRSDLYSNHQNLYGKLLGLVHNSLTEEEQNCYRQIKARNP